MEQTRQNSIQTLTQGKKTPYLAPTIIQVAFSVEVGASGSVGNVKTWGRDWSASMATVNDPADGTEQYSTEGNGTTFWN